MAQRRHKYNARKVTYFGITFDSKKEGDAYLVLRDMLAKGEIERLQVQPEFTLIPSFTGANGKKFRPLVYRADFSFQDLKQNRYRVIDIKGYRTREYMLKKKLFAYRYQVDGLEIEEEI